MYKRSSLFDHYFGDEGTLFFFIKLSTGVNVSKALAYHAAPSATKHFSIVIDAQTKKSRAFSLV
jgi:hypothetical protein